MSCDVSPEQSQLADEAVGCTSNGPSTTKGDITAHEQSPRIIPTPITSGGVHAEPLSDEKTNEIDSTPERDVVASVVCPPLIPTRGPGSDFTWTIIVDRDCPVLPKKSARMASYLQLFTLTHTADTIMICSSTLNVVHQIPISSLFYTLLPRIAIVNKTNPDVAVAKYELVGVTNTELMHLWRFSIKVTYTVYPQLLWNHIEHNTESTHDACGVVSSLVRPTIASWCATAPNWCFNLHSMPQQMDSKVLQTTRDWLTIPHDMAFTKHQLAVIRRMHDIEEQMCGESTVHAMAPTIDVDANRSIVFEATRPQLWSGHGVQQDIKSLVRVRMSGGILVNEQGSGKKLMVAAFARAATGTSLIVCPDDRLSQWAIALTRVMGSQPSSEGMSHYWRIAATPQQMDQLCASLGVILHNTQFRWIPLRIVLVSASVFECAKQKIPIWRPVESPSCAPPTKRACRDEAPAPNLFPWTRIFVDQCNNTFTATHVLHHRIVSGDVRAQWIWGIASHIPNMSSDWCRSALTTLGMSVATRDKNTFTPIHACGLSTSELSCLVDSVSRAMVLHQVDVDQFVGTPPRAGITTRVVQIPARPIEKMVCSLYRALEWDAVADACACDISANPDGIQCDSTGKLAIPVDIWDTRASILGKIERDTNKIVDDTSRALATTSDASMANTALMAYAAARAQHEHSIATLDAFRSSYFALRTVQDLGSHMCYICCSGLSEVDADMADESETPSIAMFPCGHAVHCGPCLDAALQPMGPQTRCGNCRCALDVTKITKIPISDIAAHHEPQPSLVSTIHDMVMTTGTTTLVLVTSVSGTNITKTIARALKQTGVDAVTIEHALYIPADRANVLVATVDEIGTLRHPIEITHLIECAPCTKTKVKSIPIAALPWTYILTPMNQKLIHTQIVYPA